ncbi:pyruvate formate-lyase activating enzyme [Rodentibacter pneumotropicus]|uniref:Pyruvate formate-lyase activating enzyme n=1 Tax=Rodentibacter pneumotropicus TaxID=758 RepID=A0A3S4XW14_9PAST|nr:pyruvate formate-lyase activating enzyme [Rodentibacter pneumotropicus]
MSVLGKIHSFESCGTVDGPGIRFILFMQGCLMRCKYCHNRDTWDLDGGREISIDELMKEVVSYRHFMNATGGGVTASGGEAILQAEFVRDWFRACKKRELILVLIPMVLFAIMIILLTSYSM